MKKLFVMKKNSLARHCTGKAVFVLIDYKNL